MSDCKEQDNVAMEYRRLGNSGLKVSVLSFGSWVTFGDSVKVDAAVTMMKKAFEAGVNFFDNAEMYGNGESEIVMGKALRELGWQRSQYIISTKIFWGGKTVNEHGLSRKHIIEGVNGALKRLQLDYVDLVFCHRADFETPIEETVRAMNHVIDQGKALYWGTSEWSAAQIEKAIGIADRLGLARPVMEQPQYSMLHRERFEEEYRTLFDNTRLGSTIWSPLAMGLLTGKYNNGIPADSRFATTSMNYIWKQKLQGDGASELIDKLRQLQAIADELDSSMTQLALAWCVKNPNVSTVILGASKLTQLEENLDCLKVVPRLTDDVMTRINNVLDNEPTHARKYR